METPHKDRFFTLRFFIMRDKGEQPRKIKAESQPKYFQSARVNIETRLGNNMVNKKGVGCWGKNPQTPILLG